MPIKQYCYNSVVIKIKGFIMKKFLPIMFSIFSVFSAEVSADTSLVIVTNDVSKKNIKFSACLFSYKKEKEERHVIKSFIIKKGEILSKKVIFSKGHRITFYKRYVISGLYGRIKYCENNTLVLI
jgi:hypothetical protein